MRNFPIHKCKVRSIGGSLGDSSITFRKSRKRGEHCGEIISYLSSEKVRAEGREIEGQHSLADEQAGLYLESWEGSG